MSDGDLREFLELPPQELLRTLRKQRKLSLYKLAERTGDPDRRPHFHRIEKGEAWPSAEMARMLADALEIRGPTRDLFLWKWHPLGPFWTDWEPDHLVYVFLILFSPASEAQKNYILDKIVACLRHS